MLPALLSASAALVLCVSADHGEEAVAHTADTFDGVIAEGSHFVMFYAPWWVGRVEVTRQPLFVTLI